LKIKATGANYLCVFSRFGIGKRLA